MLSSTKKKTSPSKTTVSKKKNPKKSLSKQTNQRKISPVIMDLDMRSIVAANTPVTKKQEHIQSVSLIEMMNTTGWVHFTSLIKEKASYLIHKMTHDMVATDFKESKTQYEFYQEQLRMLEMILQLPEKSIELEKLGDINSVMKNLA